MLWLDVLFLIVVLLYVGGEVVGIYGGGGMFLRFVGFGEVGVVWGHSICGFFFGVVVSSLRGGGYYFFVCVVKDGLGFGVLCYGAWTDRGFGEYLTFGLSVFLCGVLLVFWFGVGDCRGFMKKTGMSNVSTP